MINQGTLVQAGSTPSPESAPELPLPPLREDLKLLPGAAHRDGSPSWRILDPRRNQYYEIGWLEFELLARGESHAPADGLIAQVEEETTLAPECGEVVQVTLFVNTDPFKPLAYLRQTIGF